MEYTVQKLAELAGVSARTLRYYDGIGLLKPKRISSSGYRIYGPDEVDRLQQILFYRELEIPLEEIAALLAAPGFDRLAALRGHRDRLERKRARIDALLDTVQRTIAAGEGGDRLMDNEKFAGFKQELIDRNESQYGAEIREKYGETAVEVSNKKLLGLSAEQYAAMERCGEEVLRLLDAMFDAGETAGCERGRKLAAAHREWLGYSWDEYSPQAHKNLAEMYLADPRFAAYYDRGVDGRTQLLRDVVVHWAEKD